jgi:4-amino-4-deoxychorismate lyase
LKIQVHINKKSVSIKDRGFNYGDGLFETILVKNNKCLYLSDHIKRLVRGCKVLKIPTPNLKLLKSSIKKSIGKTKECIIKIIYTRGLSDHGYGYDKNIIPQLYVIKKRKNRPKIKNTISLGYSEYFLNDNSSLSKIKHMNRLEQILGTTFKPKKYL